MNWDNALEITAVSLRKNIVRLLNYWIHERLDYGLTGRGFGTDYSNIKTGEFQTRAKIAAAGHYSTAARFLPENRRAFKELLDLALSQNIRVLLLTPPVHMSFF